MKILAVRRGFSADHSSTSYEFLALDRPLDSRAKTAVARLSSRVRPTSRRASFTYNAEGYDIPGGWEPLMQRYYDVMYSESYDWWTLAVAFDTSDKLLAAQLERYAFCGVEDLGVSVTRWKDRVIVDISCRLIVGDFPVDRYADDDPEEEEIDGEVAPVIRDSLLRLLVRVRNCIMKRDFQPLYEVWKKYGLEDDDEETTPPPKPLKTRIGAAVAKELAELLDAL